MVKKVQESPYNKNALIAVGVIVGLLAIGGVSYQQGYNSGKSQVALSPEKIVEDTTKAPEIDTSSKVEATKPDIEPTTLSGTGSSETKAVELESGLYDVKFTHDGTSNFIVQLVNKMGTKLDILANEIGSYDKTRGMNITNKGPYTFNIMADGNWTMTISEYTRDN
ncbi:MAG: hypothetical protein WAV04_02885 [Candidatus Microsaccharimonas sp.]